MLNKVATYRLRTGGVLFNEIAGIDSGPLVEKGLHQGGLPLNILELSALPLEGLTWAPLFWKNWGLCTTGLQLYEDASPPYIFSSKYIF